MLKGQLKKIHLKEQALQKAALKQNADKLKRYIKNKIPVKVYNGLELAFEKAFYTIFDRGVKFIEKTYNADRIIQDYSVLNKLVKINEENAEFMNDRIKQRIFGDTFVTTVEGMGLGIFGVGLPDVLIFISFLLRGIYEISLSYGYKYDSFLERLFILTLIEASLTKGEKRLEADNRVDELIKILVGINKELKPNITIDEQIKATADACAMDMLVMKFIQGAPVVGVLGGLSNPVFYNKIMKYVQLKYYKRFLLTQMR